MLNHRRTFHIAAFLMLLVAQMSNRGVANAATFTLPVAGPLGISKLGGNSNTEGSLSFNFSDDFFVTYMNSGAELKEHALNLPLNPLAFSYSTTGPTGTFTRGLLPGLSGSNIFGGGPTLFDGTNFHIFAFGAESTTPFNTRLFQWKFTSVSSPGTPVVIYNAPSGESIGAVEAADDPNKPTDDVVVFRTDVFSSTPACPTGPTSAIQFIASMDRGTTWSLPRIIASACAGTNGLPALASPSVTFDRSDHPFFTWRKLSGTTESLQFAQGNAALTSGGTPITANTFHTPGANGILTDFYIADLTPRLVVDRSKSPFGGNVYLTYTIGGMNIADANSSTGYNVPVVVVQTKKPGALTFGAPVRLDGLTTSTKDEFSPGIVVDNSGHADEVWFDSRNDPSGVGYQVFGATSTNGGLTFGTNTPLTSLLLRQVGGDINTGSAGAPDRPDIAWDPSTNRFLVVFSASTVQGRGSLILTTITSPFP